MKKNMSFQQAYNKLEQIVNQIQQGDIDIQELVEKIKEAKQLITYCENILRKVEKQAEDLVSE